MQPSNPKPSKNEEEYFARQNAERVQAMRARLDAERAEAERRSHIMRGPRCGGHLKDQLHHHVRIEVCPDCGGTWLDKGELEMLEHVDQSNVRDFVGSLFGLKR